MASEFYYPAKLKVYTLGLKISAKKLILRHAGFDLTLALQGDVFVRPDNQGRDDCHDVAGARDCMFLVWARQNGILIGHVAHAFGSR